MKLSREQIALKKEFITKGMRLTSDCPIRTEYEKPLLDDLAQIRKRLDALMQAVRK